MTDQDRANGFPEPISEEMLSAAAADPIQLTVENRAHGWRVDHYLHRLFPNYSRSLLTKAIASGTVLLNGLPVKKGHRLRVNDVLSVKLPDKPDQSVPPEDIPLEVLFEDDHLVVINKQADLIVHPGKGNYLGTLAGGLQHHFDELSDIAGQFRPGIVHRLDRDTTGVLVVAKNNQVHHRLSRQFEQRSVTKEYRAIAWGELEFDSDYIETHLRVSQKHREKMQVCPPGGNAREAVTFYEVLERFHGFTYIRMLPKTGRTHQLRVHMQYLGHPLVADRLYGGRERLKLADLLTADQIDDLEQNPTLINRQALHAFRLEFEHPVSGETMQVEAPLPTDFERTLDALRIHRKRSR